MKAQLPHPDHYSYLRHRRERVTKIYMPVIISAVLLLALVILISVSTFGQGGDVGRWAAISTMWLSIFILIGGLITLAILVGLIYLMARALSAIPYYTGIAQDYIQLARGYIIRAADMIADPVIATETLIENIKAFFGRN